MTSTLPPDPYKALGVQTDAELPEIRSAYRKLVLKCHPDRIQDASLKALKAQEFQEVQQAYGLLSDESRRLQYDERIKTYALRKQREIGNLAPSSNPFEYGVKNSEPRATKHTYEDVAYKPVRHRKKSASYESSDQDRKLRTRNEDGARDIRKNEVDERARARRGKEVKRAAYGEKVRIRNSQAARREAALVAEEFHQGRRVETFVKPLSPPPTKKIRLPPLPRASTFASGYQSDPQQRQRGSILKKAVTYSSESESDLPHYLHHRKTGSEPIRYTINNSRSESDGNYSRNSPPSPSYEPTRRNSASATEIPKLQRANSSGYTDYTTKKMHHSMGSDYGGSEDEGAYRSRRTNRSRPSSRQPYQKSAPQ
jgi:curved DNA-binding protein CbpA